MLTRRRLLSSAGALFSTVIVGGPAMAQTAQERQWDEWDAQVRPTNYDPATTNPWGLHPRFLPRMVQTNRMLTPGDVHVDAVARYLYHIQADGMTAMRYGVAIGRGDLYIPGTFTIARKARWPMWTPTATMIERNPEYAEWAGGQPGGPANPLGARAMYLYEGGRDTYLRIHGTPQPGTVGFRASSGCVRMVMAHIIDLYEQVNTGATAYLYPGEQTVTS